MEICIAGMHRSGTSLVARVLSECGIDLGPSDELLAPNEENREGYWENKRFVELNDELLAALGGRWDEPPEFRPGWEQSPEVAPLRKRATALIGEFGQKEMWGWKDPRNSLTLRFWRQLLPDLKVVMCVRNPVEVAGSLGKRGIDERDALDLWLAYNSELLDSSDVSERIVTHYDSFFRGAEVQVRRLVDFLGVAVPDLRIAHAAAVVNEAVRHYRSNDGGPSWRANVPQPVIRCYEELSAFANAGTPQDGRVSPDPSAGSSIPTLEGQFKYREYDDSVGSTHNLVVERVPMGARVLEVGCATGYMSAVLKARRHASVTGVELSPEAAEVARTRCDRLIVGDAETLDFEALFHEERFDTIVLADVLEHLREPQKLLTRLRGLLSNTGSVIASIPNVAHGSVRLALVAGKFPYGDLGLLDQTHLRFFTLDSVRDMFELSGYSITTVARRRLGVEETEIPIPANVTDSVWEAVLADPEATTYQFIVTAAPTLSANQLHALRHALSVAREELEELRPLHEQVQKQTEDLSRERSGLERLRLAHEALKRRIVAERAAFASHVEELQQTSVRSEVLERNAQELARHASVVEQQRRELEALRTSRSLRYTAPLRQVFALLRGRPRR